MVAGVQRKPRVRNVVAASVITPLGICTPSFVAATQMFWQNAAFAASESPSDGGAAAVPHSRANMRCPLLNGVSEAYGVADFQNTAQVVNAINRFGPPVLHVEHPSTTASHITKEMWLDTNDNYKYAGNSTWVEAGFGSGTVSGYFYGPVWGRQNKSNFRRFAFPSINSIIASNSWYQFSIAEVTAGQTSFDVTAGVFNHVGSLRATSTQVTFHQPNSHKAHTASYGIEATCSYGVNQTTGTYVVKAGQSAKMTSTVSKSAVSKTWSTHKCQTFPWGNAKPFSLKWETGKTGYKFSVEMKSTFTGNPVINTCYNTPGET
jgi:hypothetical protein